MDLNDLVLNQKTVRKVSVTRKKNVSQGERKVCFKKQRCQAGFRS